MCESKINLKFVFQTMTNQPIIFNSEKFGKEDVIDNSTLSQYIERLQKNVHDILPHKDSYHSSLSTVFKIICSLAAKSSVFVLDI